VIEAGAEVGPGACFVGDAAIASGARVKDSVLWAGVSVGPEASVEGALVGPGSRIGRNAQLKPGVVLGEGSVVSDFSRSA
jgi:mannose-1-phosphate guanylyltransferase